jgi:hypothetical protein
VDVDSAEVDVLRLTAELTLERNALESATRAVSALQKMIAAYYEMFPELHDRLGPSPVDARTLGVQGFVPDLPEPPRGAEAVRMVLQERPGEWLMVTDLVDELRNRGWLPYGSDNPANAVRTALERLLAMDDSDIVKGTRRQRGSPPRVIYKYDPDEDRTARSPETNETGYGYDDDPF